MEEKLNKIIEQTNLDLKELGEEVGKLQQYYWDAFNSLRKKGVEFDEELMKEWLEEFWVIYPSKNINEWFVAIPKFINFSIGWLDHTTKGYNYYLINQYTQWLGEIPEFIRKDLNIKEPEKIFVNDSTLIFPEGKEKEIEKQYGELLSAISKGTARIKEGKEFDILAQIIESGALPFVPRSVDNSDLRQPEVKFDFEGKFSFQKQTYEMFLKYGALGIYWMTGAGKSFIAMYILDSLNGKKALVVPTLTLKEQWKEYFEKYAPRLLKEVEIYTYLSYDKMKDKEWTIVVFDECHQLPADTFSRLATLKTKYRLGLCLDKKTKIDTSKGKKTLNKIRIGDNVKSFNFSENRVEFKPVINIWKKHKEKIIITFSTSLGLRKIICSPEHKIFSSGKFIKAKDLSSGKTILFKE